jgi:hypothetical protein
MTPVAYRRTRTPGLPQVALSWPLTNNTLIVEVHHQPTLLRLHGTMARRAQLSTVRNPLNLPHVLMPGDVRLERERRNKARLLPARRRCSARTFAPLPSASGLRFDSVLCRTTRASSCVFHLLAHRPFRTPTAFAIFGSAQRACPILASGGHPSDQRDLTQIWDKRY